MLDERWQQAIAAVQDAALEPAGWGTAVASVVTLCGGRVGHLLTVGGPDWLQTNVFTGAPEGSIDYLLRHGVADPFKNPRVRHVLLQESLTCQNDLQILKPGERDRNPLYRELDRLDTGHGTWTMIARDGTLNVALAMGSEVQRAEARPHDEAAFMFFCGLIKRTVRLQLGLQGAAEGSICDALDQFSVPVFLVSASGNLNRTNACGEALLRSATVLTLRKGRIGCLCDGDAFRLFGAIDAILTGAEPGAMTVALGDALRGVTLVDLALVRPTVWSTTARRQVFVVIRGSRPGQTSLSARALAAPLALTQAEVQVAAMLAEAMNPEQIAIQRRVSIGTVRSQIKTIYQKLGVQSSGDLIRAVEGLARHPGRALHDGHQR